MTGTEIAGIGMILFQWWLIVALINRILRQAGQGPIAPLSEITQAIRSKAAPLKAETAKAPPSGSRKVLL